MAPKRALFGIGPKLGSMIACYMITTSTFNAVKLMGTIDLESQKFKAMTEKGYDYAIIKDVGGYKKGIVGLSDNSNVYILTDNGNYIPSGNME